jgi:hypothetical protein
LWRANRESHHGPGSVPAPVGRRRAAPRPQGAAQRCGYVPQCRAGCSAASLPQGRACQATSQPSEVVRPGPGGRVRELGKHPAAAHHPVERLSRIPARFGEQSELAVAAGQTGPVAERLVDLQRLAIPALRRRPRGSWQHRGHGRGFGHRRATPLLGVGRGGVGDVDQLPSAGPGRCSPSSWQLSPVIKNSKNRFSAIMSWSTNWPKYV